jgi:6-phosphogluconolactonase (cycloisomerase 2 family)
VNEVTEPAVSELHGAISGVIPRYSTARDGLPGSLVYRATPLDKEVRNLIAHPHTDAPDGSIAKSVPAAIWEFMTKPGATDELFTTELEEFDVQLRLIVANRDRYHARHRLDVPDSTEAIRAAFFAQLAELCRKESPSAVAKSDDFSLTPINVPPFPSSDESSSASGSISISSVNPFGATVSTAAPTANFSAGVVHPAPVPSGQASGGSLIVTAPLSNAATTLAWSGSVIFRPPPSAAPVNLTVTNVVSPHIIPSSFQTTTVPAVTAAVTLASPVSTGSISTSGATVLVSLVQPAQPVQVTPTPQVTPPMAVPQAVGSSTPVNTTSVTTFPAPAGFPGMYVGTDSTGTIGQFSPFTGAVVNASLISLGNNNSPEGLMIVGTTLYVADAAANKITTWDLFGHSLNSSFVTSGLLSPENMIYVNAATPYILVANNANTGTNANTVGKYNAATGAVISAGFITGQGAPFGLALSPDGTHILVSNFNGITDKVASYNLSNGALANANFIGTGLSLPAGLAVLGNVLFVADLGNDRIGTYNATTGAVINANYITKTTIGSTIGPDAESISLFGNQLFITDINNDKIEAFDVSNSSTPVVLTVATNGVNGLNVTGAVDTHDATGLVVIPEPGSIALLGFGLPTMLGLWRFRRRSVFAA